MSYEELQKYKSTTIDSKFINPTKLEIGAKSSEIYREIFTWMEQKQRHVKRYAGKRREELVRFNRKDETKFDEKGKKSSVTRI